MRAESAERTGEKKSRERESESKKESRVIEGDLKSMFSPDHHNSMLIALILLAVSVSPSHVHLKQPS